MSLPIPSPCERPPPSCFHRLGAVRRNSLCSLPKQSTKRQLIPERDVNTLEEQHQEGDWERLMGPVWWGLLGQDKG